jgi:hypothetical protein
MYDDHGSTGVADRIQRGTRSPVDARAQYSASHARKRIDELSEARFGVVENRHAIAELQRVEFQLEQLALRLKRAGCLLPSPQQSAPMLLTYSPKGREKSICDQLIMTVP